MPGHRSWWPAYVGIGSNLEDPLAQVERALRWLREIPDSRLWRRSSCFSSKPLGPQDQADYVNAVAALLTRLAPDQLLTQLQLLEERAGRRRDGSRWGPRTLDLDLLAVAGKRLASEALTLPHPEIAQRPFVCLPLAEIAPDFEVPGVGLASRLARAHAGSSVRRIDAGL